MWTRHVGAGRTGWSWGSVGPGMQEMEVGRIQSNDPVGGSFFFLFDYFIFLNFFLHFKIQSLNFKFVCTFHTCINAQVKISNMMHRLFMYL